MSEHDELGQDEPEANADEELEGQDGELLPRREVMSTINLGEDQLYSLPVEPRD